MDTYINIIGELTITKIMGIKPNFSELSRRYGIDRHTISKYYKNGGKTIKRRKNKQSYYDEYISEIIELLSKPGVTKVAAYNYLCNKYPNTFHQNYSAFKSYTLRKQIYKAKKNSIPHVRYETNPGEQLQVDWKESITMTSKHGEVINFNILSATLGYSRLHLFIYSKTKTTEDFIRCTIDVLKQLGGCPREILTDNMTAVVSITNGKKYRNKKIIQFEKDIGIKIKLCKTRSPQTKGKDESSNRFISWLLPYDGQFENEEELIDIIKIIGKQCNNQINRTTMIPPITLFAKEKEYLSPLPNNILLESYIENVSTQLVPTTLLVNYKGSGYSVPMKFINKRVKLVPIDNKLYIYYNDFLITIHTLSSSNFNYNKEHYIEALSSRISSRTDEEIETIALNNLKLFDKLKK